MDNKFDQLLKETGLKIEIVKFDSSTRTASEAASQLGCSIAQIAKSIVFKTKENNSPLLVVASGINRINEKIFVKEGTEIEKADADFVKKQTGYVIGGVPPFGFGKEITTYIDQDLLKHQTVWAAAGTPNSVFKISTNDLLKLIKGKVIKVG